MRKLFIEMFYTLFVCSSKITWKKNVGSKLWSVELWCLFIHRNGGIVIQRKIIEGAGVSYENRNKVTLFLDFLFVCFWFLFFFLFIVEMRSNMWFVVSTPPICSSQNEEINTLAGLCVMCVNWFQGWDRNTQILVCNQKKKHR